MSKLKELQQINIEESFSKARTKQVILESFQEDSMVFSKYIQCLSMVSEFLEEDKGEVLNELFQEYQDRNSMEDTVTDLLILTLSQSRAVELTAVVGRLAAKMDMAEYFDAVTVLAEFMGIMCQSDLFDLIPAKYSNSGMIEVVSNYNLDSKVKAHIQQMMYLPPMVSKPLAIRKNNDGAHYTKKHDHIVLKAQNSHNKPLALDVINIANGVKWSLDPYVLDMYEEPSKEFETEQQEHQFYEMVEASHYVYEMLLENGNEFYLTNKFDKRGRVYTQGYHVNLQSTEYKKALLNFSKQEIIPTDY